MHKIINWFINLANEYERRKILHNKLNDLTDHGFFDRIEEQK